MGKGIVTLGFLSLALAGCYGGVASPLPDDVITYKFDAKVAVNPTVPVVNERVSLNLQLVSSSSRDVKTDIFLKVVNAAGDTIYESRWEDVLFHEREVWNLSQGFKPDASASKSAWTVQITVKDHVTQAVLYDEAAATLDFAQ